MWRHADNTDSIDVHFAQETCFFCGTKLLFHPIENRWVLDSDTLTLEHHGSIDDSVQYLGDTLVSYREIESNFFIEDLSFKCCPSCGWWCINQWITYQTPDMPYMAHQSAAGALLTCESPDVDASLVEVRSYLCALFDRRFAIDPFVMEDVVGSILKSSGFDVHVTSRSSDGGIDVFGHDSSGNPFGVQVRRSKGMIGVDQIPEFVGALHLNGLAKGIFVTTSKFTRGSKTLISKSQMRGVRLELKDAEGLFEMLKIAQVRDFDASSLSQLAETYCTFVPNLLFDGCMPMNSY